MYKLIAVDLDGTFLNKESQVPEENKIAVEYLLNKGVHFVFCSGRASASINNISTSLGLNRKDVFGISYNGGKVYYADTLEPLVEYKLKKEIAQTVLREAIGLQVERIVYDKETLICSEETNFITGHFKRNRVPHQVIKNLENYPHDVSKVLLIGEYDDLVQIRDNMEKKLAGKCNIFFSERFYLEFTDLQASKGTGLQYLANHLAIDMKDVIAIGDNFNDVSMIQQAGVGVVMKNGEEEVKKIADYVTETDNNSGVLKEIVMKFF